jgi:hypothetical protein
MAIIDPDGLFSGERLAACSDIAQLYWPRFFLASNGCARIELSYKSLVSRVFGNFHQIPTSEEIWQVFREYEKNYLAVLYETNSGVWWCQFVTSQKFLPKYKKTRDNMSPAPPPEMMEVFDHGYHLWKKANSFQNESFQKSPAVFSSQGIGIGVGIGVGEGIGELQKPSGKKPHRAKSPDPRHSLFRESLEKYWAKKNPVGQSMPWGPADAKQLSLMLAANPAMDLEGFRDLLRNRAKSDVAHGDPVRRWIGNVTSFTVPLDRYGKPMTTNGRGGNYAHLSDRGPATTMAVSAELIARGEHQSTFGEDGHLPPSEDERERPNSDAGDVHRLPEKPRPKGFPSGDGYPF